MSDQPASAPEFSRICDIRHLPPRAQMLVATAAECTDLAARFGLVQIDRLTAEVALAEGKAGRIDATGRLMAQVVQSCVVSGEDVPARLDVPLALVFVPAAGAASGDIDAEIDADGPDEIDYTGSSFDLGEAVAQSLMLALDPFPRAPGAEKIRAAAGIVSEDEARATSGPFAALDQLRR